MTRLLLLFSIGLLFLAFGCRKDTPLASYEGRWTRKDVRSLEDIVTGDSREVASEYLARLLAAKIPLSGHWEIREGKILSVGNEEGAASRIDESVLEENLNFAEILVHHPDYGFWVIRIELRDGELRVYPDKFSHDYVALVPFEDDVANP